MRTLRNDNAFEVMDRARSKATVRALSLPTGWLVGGGLALITATGALLRWRLTMTKVLWEDEITTAVVARMGFRGILHWTRTADLHPPLYHLVTHFLMRGLQMVHAPQSVVILGSIRYPSLVFGILSIPMAFLVGRDLHSRRAGLLAAGLIAVSPIAVWYSAEGRMYAMVWFFVLASYWLMLRARGWWLIPYALSVAAALYTDYSAALALIPQGAYLVLTRRWQVAGAYAAGCALFVPWLPILRQQLMFIHGQSYAAYPPTLRTAQVLLLDQVGAGASYATLGQIGIPFLALAALAVLAVVLAAKRPAGTAVVASLVFGSLIVAVALVATGSHALLAPRVVGLIGVGILIAAALAAASSERVGSLAVAAVLVSSMAAVITVERSGSTGQPWDVVAQRLASDANPADAVVYYPEAVRLVVEVYAPDHPSLAGQFGSWPLPDPVMDQQLVAWSEGHPRLWLVYIASTGIDVPEHDAFLQAHGFGRVSGDPTRYVGVIEYLTPNR